MPGLSRDPVLPPSEQPHASQHLPATRRTVQNVRIDPHSTVTVDRRPKWQLGFARGHGASRPPHRAYAPGHGDPARDRGLRTARANGSNSHQRPRHGPRHLVTATYGRSCSLPHHDAPSPNGYVVADAHSHAYQLADLDADPNGHANPNTDPYTDSDTGADRDARPATASTHAIGRRSAPSLDTGLRPWAP